MSEEAQKPLEEAAGGIKTLFDKVGEFLHLFDLSFLVSGAATFAALATLYLRSDLPDTFPFPGWVGVAGIIIGAYIAGLISFAAGRAFSATFLRGKLDQEIIQALRTHDIADAVSMYQGKGDDVWRLYERMWQQLVLRRPKSATLTHLSRYWMMAATYDGVAVSLLVWAAVAFVMMLENPPLLSLWAGSAIIAACILAAGIAFYQGRKYFVYQIKDLAAWLAAESGPLT